MSDVPANRALLDWHGSFVLAAVEDSLVLDGSLRLLKVRLQPSFPASERLKYMEGCTYFVNDWWQTPRPYFLCCNIPISAVWYHISMNGDYTYVFVFTLFVRER